MPLIENVWNFTPRAKHLQLLGILYFRVHGNHWASQLRDPLSALDNGHL